ncbi:hypothetical protein MASR2M39_25430 [Ignavibacteriales bacterium]
METEKKETKTTGSTQEELVKRGEYLVVVSGCDDCHSPKVFGPKGPAIDPERRLSVIPKMWLRIPSIKMH